MTTEQLTSLIRPIITDVYGKSEIALALINYLASRILSYEPQGEFTRERMITLVCWDWFSGGATAAFVASQVENVLNSIDIDKSPA